MKKYLLYSEKPSITKQTQNNNYKKFQEHPYPYMMIKLIKYIFTLIKIKLITDLINLISVDTRWMKYFHEQNSTVKDIT